MMGKVHFYSTLVVRDGIANMSCGAMIGDNKNEVIGLLYELLHKEFPANEGYAGHSVQADTLSERLLLADERIGG